ncbi:MAG: hypothetical protein M3Y74_18005, partial [Chloroflexota bacterium]|nr:hypothetical protein [Chloroflexota bacterium]
MIRAAHYHIARKRAVLVWALAGALLVLGTVFAGLRIVASRHAVAATVQPGIMAGLVVRGHHQAVAATLDGGIRKKVPSSYTLHAGSCTTVNLSRSARCFRDLSRQCSWRKYDGA